jgi:hypothetical protein
MRMDQRASRKCNGLYCFNINSLGMKKGSQ